MKYSAALKWGLALLLPLTLVWKVSVPIDNFDDVANNIVAFLARHNFEVQLTAESTDYMPIIRASAEGCRLFVAKSSAYGWNRDIIRDLATGTDTIFFVFRGRVYRQQPTWITVAYYHWSRLQRVMRLIRHSMPVLAIVEERNCNAEQLPWGDVGSDKPPQATRNAQGTL